MKRANLLHDIPFYERGMADGTGSFAYSCTAGCTSGVTHYDQFDLFGSYDLGKSVQLQAGIDNVGDERPPPYQSIYGNTNVGEYDILGRTYWASVRVQFH